MRTDCKANLFAFDSTHTYIFDIVIRKSDTIRTAYQRTIVSDRSECGKILEEMRRHIPDTITGSRTIVIDYETEFFSRNFDIGFGVEITGKLPKFCGLCENVISFAGDTANLVCNNATYEDGVQALHKYVLDHDYQITGPVYKIMYNDGTVEIKFPVVKLGNFDMDCNEERTTGIEILKPDSVEELNKIRDFLHERKVVILELEKYETIALSYIENESIIPERYDIQKIDNNCFAITPCQKVS